MPAGDIVSNIANIANGEYLDMRPAAGVTWCMHNISYMGAMELYFYDGTSNLKLDADSTPGAKLNLALHCNNTRYYRLKNVSGASTLMSYDGVQTNGSMGSSDNAEVYCGEAAADSVGVDGDIYVNKTTGDVYNKSSATWGSPIGSISGALVARYVHSSNTEVVVSAVDVATNTFTSVGHPLSNGDRIYTAFNENIGNIYPYGTLPGGIAPGFYFVVNTTVDTFQASATFGGQAIDITDNANLDVSKWHFERGYLNIVFTELPSSKKYRVHVKGRQLGAGTSWYVLINDMVANTNEWLRAGNTTYNWPIIAGGNILIDVNTIVDSSSILSEIITGITMRANTASDNTGTNVSSAYMAPAYIDVDITKITVAVNQFVNGTTIEVYKL